MVKRKEHHLPMIKVYIGDIEEIDEFDGKTYPLRMEYNELGIAQKFNEQKYNIADWWDYRDTKTHWITHDIYWEKNFNLDPDEHKRIAEEILSIGGKSKTPKKRKKKVK